MERFSEFSCFVERQLGLHFTKERWKDLKQGLIRAAKEFGFSDPEMCLRWMVSTPLTRKEIEILASHLTVGETYFFREKKSFSVLKNKILPELILNRSAGERRLRFWSAGCCSGEEPYSLAILLRDVLPVPDTWQITILGTDINPFFLKKAERGIYGQWSFREKPQEIQERCFKKTIDGKFEILPVYKKMVTLSYHNLAEDSFPSLHNHTNAMDVIFCRNVLMYFSPEWARRVVDRLYRCLVEGGWLMVSPCETSQTLFSEFVPVHYPDVILYQKRASSHGKARGVDRDSQKPQIPCSVHREVLETQEKQEGEYPSFETPHRKLETERNISKENASTVLEENLYQAALSLFEQGRYAEAAEQAIKMVNTGTKGIELFTLLARIYSNQGDLDEALIWCERGISIDKLIADLHFLHATILQEKGQEEEAHKSFKRVLYLDPNYILAHVALGNICRQNGNTAEGQKYFENALTLLEGHSKDHILPHSEGMTAGRLSEIVFCMKGEIP